MASVPRGSLCLGVERSGRHFTRRIQGVPPQHVGPLGDEIALVLGAETYRAFDQPKLEAKTVGGAPDPVEPERTPSWTMACQIATLGNAIGEFGFQSFLDWLAANIVVSEQNICSSHLDITLNRCCPLLVCLCTS